MRVQILSQLENGGLSDARHQILREIIGDGFENRKPDEKSADCRPRFDSVCGNIILQIKERRRAFRRFAARQSLIKNRNEQREPHDFKQSDRRHRRQSDNERAEMRL